MKILFVDDVRDTRDLFRLAFSMQGHHTHLACNGLEALAAVREENFDALVIDVEMPDMDGWEAVRRIRALPGGARMPIILFTAYSRPESRRKAGDSGADLLLCKPILPQEILKQIMEIVEERESSAPQDIPEN